MSGSHLGWWKYPLLPFVWLWGWIHKSKDYPQTVRPGLRTLTVPVIMVQGADLFAFQEAAKIWNKVLPPWRQFAATTGVNLPPHITVLYQDENVDPGKSGKAVWTATQATIYIRPKDRGEIALLVHELGHCLGFNHTDDIRCVMYPTVFTTHISDKIKAILANGG